MKLLDRLLRRFVTFHLDESEATRAACGLIAHHAHGLDCPRLAEQIFEFLLAGGKGQVANEQFAAHN